MRTISELSKSFSEGSASPAQAAGELLDEIEGRGKMLNCFITVLRESALKQAEESEKRFKERKSLGPLDGIPVAVKDLIYVKGVRCTAGSKILAENVAPYDSPVAARLKGAGAVLVGTTNMHEFAAGVTGENPHYGAVRNPWDPARISGGSSSGSAAAVSAGLVPCAVGSDTGGSVRIPAGLCGVIGFKPTYGRVSRLGVVPLAASFDTVGILSSCSWDAAALLGVLAGHDAEDLTTVAADVPDYTTGLEDASGGMRVGVPRKHFHENVDSGVEEAFSEFLGRLSEAGNTVVDVELDGIEEAGDCWRTIRMAEATAFHLRWLESAPLAYGEDVRALLEQGRSVSAVDYVNAQNLRPTVMQRFAASMKDVDAVAVPTTAATAPKLGERSVRINGAETDVRSALIAKTFPFNVAGFPAVSVPAGLAKGLPVGAQLVARPFEEAKLFRLVRSVEKLGPFPEAPRTV
ncbi:MAG TPA: amidase [Nitrososphaerales archaeon]|nr:amidase [Nitrososphaerales archaeon]